MTRHLLTYGAQLGDRFVAVLGKPNWIAAGDLFGAQLGVALTEVGKRRGTSSPAVAGTLLFEQYAQRLLAPVLAALFRDSAVVAVEPDLVRVEVADGALRRLAFATPARQADDAEDRVLRDVVGDHLTAVADAVHDHTRVGTRVLRGSIANAIANTLLHLSWPEPERDRYVDGCRTFLARVPGLAELVNVESIPVAGEPWMYTDRNTCCLAFRTTTNQARDQRFCATCPLTPRSATRALFMDATASYAARHPR
jgi:hypothetical protein